MAYPDYTTPRSIAGAAEPTYLASALASGYSAGQTIVLADTYGWYEVSSSGTATTNPLGTSGIFTLVVDYGAGTEEKILCASGAITIGTNASITVWTDGTYNGRGWDGTTAVAHTVGSGSNPNVFLVRTAVDDLQFNTATVTIANNLATLSGQYVATSGIVTSNTSSIATISSTLNTVSGVAYAALPASGGTMSGAIAMGSNKITGLANGSASTDAAAFGQIPTALPPNGSAGGDLTGTYPNPTVAQIQGKAISTAQATLLSGIATGTTTRSGSTTVGIGEVSVVTGSSAITLTLPVAPAGTINTIVNESGATVTVTAGIALVGTTSLPPGTSGQFFSTSSSVSVWFGTMSVWGTVLPVLAGGTGVTTSTGSGSVVLNTSPSLTTPSLGVATATSVTANVFTPTVSGVTVTTSPITITPSSSTSYKITNNATPVSSVNITLSTSGASDGMQSIVRFYDSTSSGIALTWTNTESSTNVSVPSASTGVFNSPITVGFIYNGATSKWRCVAVA